MRNDIKLSRDFPVYITYYTPPIYPSPLNWHTCLEIGCCISGKGSYFCSDKAYDICPGDVIIINSLERHRGQSDKDNPCTFIYVFFDPTIFEQDDRRLLLPFFTNPKKIINKINATSETAKKIGTLIKHTMDEVTIMESGYKSIVKGALLQICGLLYRYYGNSTPLEIWHENMANPINVADFERVLRLYERLQPALNYIKENFKEPIDLNKVADVLSLSPSRTYHLFQETSGVNFKEYLTLQRVNEAKRLLVHTDLKVTDIYLSCGFESPTSFYRSFKQVVNLKPKEFREQYKMYNNL